MGGHECTEMRYCICDSQALEPDENCPIHSMAAIRPRCKCGKFVKRPRHDSEV